MFTRREEQIKSLGVGFPVTMGPHDTAYDLLPEIVSRMYTEGVADKVCIYNRNFEKYYDTDEVPNPDGIGIIKAVIKSRDDYLNADSLSYIKAAWESVYENMLKREASGKQLQEVMSYYNAFRKNSGIYMIDRNDTVKYMLFKKQNNHS